MSEPPPNDLRGSPLYLEAEKIYRQLLHPGSGRPATATELTVSPDGKFVAFTGTLLETLEGTAATRICMADVSSGSQQVLSLGPNADATPKFSPDGRWLAFRSDRAGSGNFQVYLLDLKSGATCPAPQVDGWVENLEFSPDGRRLLLVAAGFGADASAIDGARGSKRADDGTVASWMPAVETGDEAFRRRSAWIIDLQSRKSRRASRAALNVWEACWCGNSAIAAIVTKGASEGAWYRAELVRIDLKSKTSTVLFRPPDQLGWLSGSPDGRRLAIVAAVCSDRGLCAGDLMIVDIRSSNVHRVDSLRTDVTSTAWRDDKQLLLSGIRDLETTVVEIDATTGRARERWVSQQLYSPNPYYPRAVPCGREGFVMPVHGPLQPLCLIHVGRGTPRTIVSLGSESTSQIVKNLRPMEPYRWKAADGQEIQGWLMQPPGRKPAALIMDVHGGPIWRWPPFFLGRSAHYAMLAARGYAMFWPNPRGSSGRGQGFARAVMGDMGGADAQDCLSGLDELITARIADPKRLGVMGNSYGGFMSAWLITQDQRFAAAIPCAPIANWVSQHLTTNIPFFDPVYLASDYRESAGNHHARSPVMFAHRARTPTLSVCGALDRCSPPTQAQEFHSALLENGVPSVLVTYPREGHGIRSFPAMIDFSARIVDWFVRYMPPNA